VINQDVKLHYLLARQLKRLGLSEEAMPLNPTTWNKFLTHINHAYNDADQERYLLERSMEISSKEMMELNKSLEEAQRIAHLGYWFYNTNSDKIYWSKETYHLFECDPHELAPTMAELLNMIHEEERPILIECIDKAKNSGISYQLEIRIHTKMGKLRWLFVKGQPHSLHNEPLYNLTGIVMDVTDRKIAEEQMKELHRQLMISARQAGMADVAISVLHNIGNILNSAYVSVKMMQEIPQPAYINKLEQIATLINQHALSHEDFVICDKKGKLIADYLFALIKSFHEEYNKLTSEINNMDIYLKNIKEIVVRQNDMRGSSDVIEKVYLPDMIDLAIKMSIVSKKSKEIELIKLTNQPIFIHLDRSKLLQILVNLLRNAKESILSCNKNDNNKITIQLKKRDDKQLVDIIISDTGMGIEKANLTKIFSVGFTTKKEGHGYGLHSSSLTAIELGGNLTVQSEGISKGATFFLELPLSAHRKTKEDPKDGAI
jgi:PAS domain S-box-containing protein